MKKLICLAAMIILLNSITISAQNGQQVADEGDYSINKPITLSKSTLKFNDYIGQTFGDAQLRSLINFISNATTVYPLDASKRLFYIKTNMDASFGNINYQYSVISESHSTQGYYGNATFYCEGGTNFAFIGYGVYFKSNWTYLVYKLYSPSSSYAFIDRSLDRGSGITEDQGNQIISVLNAVDGTNFCDCSRIDKIKDNLQKTIIAKWNVVCQHDGVINSYAAIFNSSWFATRRSFDCQYFIYALK